MPIDAEKRWPFEQHASYRKASHLLITYTDINHGRGVFSQLRYLIWPVAYAADSMTKTVCVCQTMPEVAAFDIHEESTQWEHVNKYERYFFLSKQHNVIKHV